MRQVVIIARVTVKDGRADEYLAAFAALLEQAAREPGTLVYAVNRSSDDPRVFFTVEVYADAAAFAAHSSSEVHAAASPVFTELIAASDVTIGETLLAHGLPGVLAGGLRPGTATAAWPARGTGAAAGLQQLWRRAW